MRRAIVLIVGLGIAFMACNTSPNQPTEIGDIDPDFSTESIKAATSSYNVGQAVRYATSYYNNCYTDETEGDCRFASDKIPFPNFDSDRADPKDRPGNCTNFFSQILMASLVGTNIKANPTPQEVWKNRTRFADKEGSYQWYFNKKNSDYSSTWVSAPQMETYAVKQNAPTFTGWNFKFLGQVLGNSQSSLLNTGKLKEGDVIFGAIDRKNPGVISHAMLVTKVDGCSILGCSNDRNDDDRIKVTYQSANQRDVSFLKRLRENYPNSNFRAYRPVSFRSNGKKASVANENTAERIPQ
jgi:cytochrome c1